MRYFIVLLIPALIFVGVVYLLTHRGRPGAGDDQGQPPQISDTGAFIAILVVSAVVALGTAYALVNLWE